MSRANENGNRDDDELVRSARDTIAQWQAASGIPSLTQVQELFYESICAGASPMARDKIVAAITTAFGAELGGKRALGTTWNRIVKQFVAECAQSAREKRRDTTQAALTPAEKAKLREALWPKVRELAEAPDLIDRVVQQVHAMGEGRRPWCRSTGPRWPASETRHNFRRRASWAAATGARPT